MKVCLASPYLYPTVIGGAERYVFSLARSLRKLGLDIVVATAKPPDALAKNPFEDIRVRYLNPIFRIGVNPVTPALFEVIKQEKPDIVHTQAPSIVADLSVLSCKSSAIPIASTYHADITESFVPHALMSLYNHLHFGLTLRRCDHVITTTERYMTKLGRMGLPKHKVNVIPVGIERDFVQARISKKAEDALLMRISELGLNPAFTLLFVGVLDSHHMYKGVEGLLRAFKRVVAKHSDSLLILVGDGDKRPYYEILCGKLGLRHNVLFLGFISKELLVALYSLSDSLILPSVSLSEGFGTVLLEAMSRGCPVITTAYAGGSEVVQKEEAGIVVSTADSLSLSRAIAHMAENKSSAKKWGRNGQDAIGRKYTWNVLSPKFVEVYRGCISNNRLGIA